MKTRIATSMFAVVLLAVGMAAAASAQEVPSLMIHPLAVMLQPDSSQYFLAQFSDGSPVASCTWKATGVGRNGVKLTTIDRDWAVFYDGSLGGVNYVISAECQNWKGISSSTRAFVFVK